MSEQSLRDSGMCPWSERPCEHAASCKLTAEKACTKSIRDSGVCPWSRCACKRAPLCVLTAEEACAHVVNRNGTCPQCKEDTGAECEDVFLCFKEVRDIRLAQRKKDGPPKRIRPRR